MVIVAQLVRAPDCGSGGRGFEPRLSPFKKALSYDGAFSLTTVASPQHLTSLLIILLNR